MLTATIRTIHHQACTGGSVISRCIAALPGVALLSEVSPAGESRPKQVRFAPLDVVGAFLNSYPEARPDITEMTGIFGQQLQLVSDLAVRAGLDLVVRDHAHTDYMRRTMPERPTLLDACTSFDTVHSLVTVRYPFASWLSLGRTGWNKHVQDYEDYCRRYLRFLDHHPTTARIQYEAFCADPQATIRSICDILDIGFDPTFEERWHAQTVTGNSGRGATMGHIEPLPFRDWTAERAEQLDRTETHAELCHRLGYPADLTLFAQEANHLANEHGAGAHTAHPLRRLLRRQRRRWR